MKSFTDYVSGIPLPKRTKLTVNWKNVVIVEVFWCCFSSLVKFSYLSKFHVNIITSSGVMTISFCKRLTRNPEIGNIPVWVLPNIWRLGQVKNSKFGTNVSNKILLNAAKSQGYSFNRIWVIEGKPTGGKKLPPNQITVTKSFFVIFRPVFWAL